MTAENTPSSTSVDSIVRRPPAICCPECGHLCVYVELGKNYPCERCGVLWRWYCRSGKLEDIETVKVCDDCNGEKFVTEQDYWDRAHCAKCDGKGVL